MRDTIFIFFAELFSLGTALFQSFLLLKGNALNDVMRYVALSFILINVILLFWWGYRVFVFSKSVILRPNPNKVKEYLYNWIKSSDRTAIVSRDLSWVVDEIKEELIRKAKARELIVILPTNNEVSRELMKAGAEVRYYMYGSECIYREQSALNTRFIVAGYGSDPRLTSPKITNHYHINEEFSSNDRETKISLDLVSIIRKTTHITVPFQLSEIQEINDNIEKWLINGGRCFILSRDLSWAENDQIRKCLLEKSKRHEIIVIMEKENEISKELMTNGADVRYYEKFNYEFRNRFIISHWGTEGAELTVPTKQDNMHINHIYNSGHRIHAYAMEIAEFLTKVIVKEQKE